MRKQRERFKALIIPLIVTLFIALVVTGFPLKGSRVKASPATIYVPDDYSTIQAAVDAASPGDTTAARDGTYTENVDANKEHLTIQSENQAGPPTGLALNPDDHVFNEGKADDHLPIETFENYEDKQILFIHDGSTYTHSITNTDWDGYSDLAAMLEGEGFTVDEQNLYPISLDDLVKYEVVGDCCVNGEISDNMGVEVCVGTRRWPDASSSEHSPSRSERAGGSRCMSLS